MEIKDILKQLNNEKELILEEITKSQNRLDEINTTISTIEKIMNNTKILCPECNGCGQKFYRSCAEDEGEYKTCSKCKGRGKITI